MPAGFNRCQRCGRDFRRYQVRANYNVPVSQVARNLSGKTVVPLITHGGYGLGDSLTIVAKHAPQARLVEGFSMQGPQERQTVTRVLEWLEAFKSTE